MGGIVDSSYFPPRFILVGLCAYFIEALRVQRYEKFLIYANIGGIFCKNRRITSDTMNNEKSPIQTDTKEERHYCRLRLATEYFFFVFANPSEPAYIVYRCIHIIGFELINIFR